MVEMPTPIKQYGSSDLICSIKGTSDIVDDNIAVSPSGDALSPREPPAKTDSIIRAKLVLVATAIGIAIGIRSAHVPHAEPIK